MHTRLGIHIRDSWEHFDIFVLPKESSEISFLSQNEKSTLCKAGGKTTTQKTPTTKE